MKEKLFLFFCLSSITCNPTSASARINSTGQGFPNILDKSTVEEGEMFTITCNYQTFDFTNETVDSILSIIMERIVADLPKEKVIYMLLPTEPGVEYLKMFPDGRIWDVWASMGGDDFKGQKEKVSLKIAVLDTKMGDSGDYTCYLEYYAYDLRLKKRTEHLKVTKSTYVKPTYTRRDTRTSPTTARPSTKSPVANQPILDKSTVEEGGTFTMTCDFKRFEIINTGIVFDNVVKCVTLSRRLDGSPNYSLIYCFCPYRAKCDRISGIPPGRTWDVHIDHGDHDHYFHQEFISLSVTVKDAILADSGSYECDELFNTERRLKRSETLRVIKGKTRPATTAAIKAKTEQATTAVIKSKTDQTTTAVIKGKTEQTTTGEFKQITKQTTAAVIKVKTEPTTTGVIKWKTEQTTTAVFKGETEQTTPEEIKGATEQTKTAGRKDLELTTSKNQSNSKDKKDYQQSVLIILMLILVMTWLL